MTDRPTRELKLSEGNEMPFKRVLIIEDDYVNDFKRGLDTLGIAYDTASNFAAAKDALDDARPGDYDAVFLDHHMPIAQGTNPIDCGYGLLLNIRDKFSEALVIGTSSIYHEKPPEYFKNEFLDIPDHNIQKISELTLDPAGYLAKVFEAIKNK